MVAAYWRANAGYLTVSHSHLATCFSILCVTDETNKITNIFKLAINAKNVENLLMHVLDLFICRTLIKQVMALLASVSNKSESNKTWNVKVCKWRFRYSFFWMKINILMYDFRNSGSKHIRQIRPIFTSFWHSIVIYYIEHNNKNEIIVWFQWIDAWRTLPYYFFCSW